jgi:branched-chain amino acid transport system substrate-binding protein
MKRCMFALVAILLCSIMVIPSNSFAEKPDSLQIGLIGDFSGPYAPVVGPTRPGTLDAWDYLNDKEGGVAGVKVKPILKDMAGKLDVGLSQYNELINMKPKPVFIDTYITPLSAALRERYVENDVVGFHAGAVESLYPVRNNYGYYCLYPEQAAVALKWVKDNWKGKGNLKIGIITWDTGYGRAILTDEFYAYAKKIGVDIVDTQLFGIREVDVTTQLMKLRAKKPDFLLTNLGGSGSLAIKRGCKEMGWKINLLNGIGGGWGTVALDPAIFEGDITVLPVKSFDEVDDPSIKTVMKYFNQSKRTVRDKTLFYLIGWYVALAEHKIMNQVVKEHGWKGLTTKNIVNALNKMKDYKPLHGITVLSYSEKRRTPTVARVYKISKGKLLPLTDFLEVPDLRPAKYK